MKFEPRRLWTLARTRFGVGGLILIGGLLIAEGITTATILSGESPIERGIFDKLGANERLSIHENILYGTWVAKLSIAILCAILLGFSWWWARDVPSGHIAKLNPKRFGWGLWVPLLLAVVLAGAWRVPRLDHSLWNDEELAVRKYIVGGHSVNLETGELKFNELPWERTLFYSLNGQNHTVQSIASRIGYEIWKKYTNAGPGEFSEVAIRIGSLLAGLATVALIGFWLAQEGHPRAGVTAAFVLALNPWHIRYSVEARGYSFLLMFLVIMFICVRPALQTKKWRYWIGYGAGQALAILSFAASVFIVLPLNLVIGGILISKRDSFSGWRWIFVSVCGAALVDFFMLPTVIGFMGWLDSLNETVMPYDMAYFREFWGHLMLGVPWRAAVPEFEAGIGVRNVFAENWLKEVIIIYLLPLLVLAGTVFAVLRSTSARLFCGTMGVTILTVMLYCKFSDTPFHGWYAIYVLLWFVVALGFVGGAARVLQVRKSSHAILSWLPVIVVVLGYAWITVTPRRMVAAHDRHPMRQTIEMVRGEAPAIGHSGNIQTVAFGAGAKQFRSYDPRIQAPSSIDEFKSIWSAATAKGDQVYVLLTGPNLIRNGYPELYEILEDRDDFTNRGIVQAIEYFWSIQVFESK